MPKKILVLNDTPETLDLYTENLTDAGYRVIASPYYLRDLSLIKETNPDLVIVDYNAAEEERIWKLIHLMRLSRATQHIPVLVCLGLSNRTSVPQAYLHAQNILTLAKPFSADAFLATVGSMFAPPTALAVSPQQPAVLESFARHVSENIISDIPYRVLANEYSG
jgi:adenylate cyclase